jgi:tripartite-type tricarboxylate transporter receptor subunit TctC
MLLNAVIDPKPHFLPQNFAWIGRFAALASYGIAWHAAPAKTLEQAKAIPLIMGAAPGAGPGVTVVTALNKLAGTKFKVVQGYKSVSESALALERGELQGISSVSWEFLTSKHWTDGKTVSLLFVNAMERTQVKPDVPTIIDAVSDHDDRAVMKLIASVSDLGRAILAPPNVPPDRIDALRQAFDRFIHDPVAQAEAHRRNIDMDPLSGQAVENLVINTMTVSPAVVEKARGVIPTH